MYPAVRWQNYHMSYIKYAHKKRHKIQEKKKRRRLIHVLKVNITNPCYLSFYLKKRIWFLYRIAILYFYERKFVQYGRLSFQKYPFCLANYLVVLSLKIKGIYWIFWQKRVRTWSNKRSSRLLHAAAQHTPSPCVSPL